ncbi:MAG: hypothetical protein HGB11_13530 [Chlorobiales bacterium]|nr:hypothetical protein [Chlorobiales bacterium]
MTALFLLNFVFPGVLCGGEKTLNHEKHEGAQRKALKTLCFLMRLVVKKTLNHEEHKGAQREALKTLCFLVPFVVKNFAQPYGSVSARLPQLMRCCATAYNLTFS